MSETIDHKVSVSPLLPGVSVSLNAQPYGGFHVVVFSSAGNEPSELYSGLRAVGFTSRDPVAQPAGVVRQSCESPRGLLVAIDTMQFPPVAHALSSGRPCTFLRSPMHF